MSEKSNAAADYLNRAALGRAYDLACEAVRAHPLDWHGHYILGHCLNSMSDTFGAIRSFEKANELEPRMPTILLALGIAKQSHGSYGEAIGAFKAALDVDPDFVPVINSLAMTQKLMGEPVKADHNYEYGLTTLSKNIVARWENRADNVRHPHADSRTHIWVTYANTALLWLAARDTSVKAVALPTAEMAEEDAATGNLKGWYWHEFLDGNGQKTRLYYPNFFNTFHFSLAQSRIYKDLIGNRSTVLRMLGRDEEAEAHLQEAIDFSLSETGLTE